MSDVTAGVVSGCTQQRSLWELIATALLLGVVGAAAGLVFLGVTGVGADWYGDPGLGWFDGRAVVGGRRGSRGPRRGDPSPRLGDAGQDPGLIEDLQSEHIDTKLVPKVVAVSAVWLTRRGR